MSVKERFKILLKALNTNPTKLAKDVNVSAQAFHSIITKDTQPSGKILTPLVEVYPSINLNWLLAGQEPMLFPENSTAIANQDLLLLKNTVESLEKSLELREKNAKLMEKYLEVVEEKVKNLEQELADTKAKLKKHNN
ncbi:hypothetical protein [Aureispira sp. CCB-E]|uniref:hypothetical protein n=1 Tax=Aureispira sp. CCB-E TaxID=3051121 RepID=UPI0028689751|nr:hypothetical protein [Aureispira sp. CCB-E]WMX16302.1 hypothetical protein QP953_07985 [Aureispira sp. CCB-E]